MAQSWFVKEMGAESGPYSSSTLKVMAQNGTIQPDSLVRRGSTGEWVSAHRIQGLFDSPSPQPAKSAAGAVAVAPAPVEVEALPEIEAESYPPMPDEPAVNLNLVACEDCGEGVSRRAAECPHCGSPRAVRAGQNEQPSTQKRYSTIQSFARLFKIAAVLVILIGLVVLVRLLEESVTMGIGVFSICCFCATMLFFQAELLSAIVDVEFNTRRTSDYMDYLLDAARRRQ